MSDAEAQIEAIWRIEGPKIIAALSRLVRDVGLAEDLAQDALVQALESWPTAGRPVNPAAWLMRTAKHRAVDRFRRNRMMRDKHHEVARELDAREDVSIAMIEQHMDDDIGDERLSLLFTACHPLLGRDARAALTLRLIGGLTPGEIARAYLSSETTIQQRIVRAKKQLRESGVSYDVPHGAARAERLPAVLEVIYLIFNEGYVATSGFDLMRPVLSNEAIRLGRILAGLVPSDPEVLGLLALMELTAARFPARIAQDGTPILLDQQDRMRWDRALIRHGLDGLAKAQRLSRPAGPYRLQAEIAACHARANTASETDWARIAALYEALERIMPSPVVALNRSVAIGMAFGPAAGLTALEALSAHAALDSNHLVESVRGDLLEKLGRLGEAGAAFTRAADLASNAQERGLLTQRARMCRDAASQQPSPRPL